MDKLRQLFIAGCSVSVFTFLLIAPAFVSTSWRMEATFEVIDTDSPHVGALAAHDLQGTLRSIACSPAGPSTIRCRFEGQSLFDAKDYLQEQGIKTSNRFLDTSMMPVFLTPALVLWQLLLAAAAALSWNRWTRLEIASPRWEGRNTILALLLPYAASTATVGILFAAFGTAESVVEASSGMRLDRNIWLIAATSIIAAPLYEEILFRGLALDALRRAFSWPIAILATSVTFVSMHTIQSGPAGLTHTAALLAAGIALGWLRKMTGSLMLCVLAHAIFNLITLVTMLRVGSISLALKNG